MPRHILDLGPISRHTPLPQRPPPFDNGEDCQIVRQTQECPEGKCVLLTVVLRP
jgi:hypothetical protein